MCINFDCGLLDWVLVYCHAASGLAGPSMADLIAIDRYWLVQCPSQLRYIQGHWSWLNTPNRAIYTCASALCKPLHYLFCLCLDSGYLYLLNGRFTKLYQFLNQIAIWLQTTIQFPCLVIFLKSWNVWSTTKLFTMLLILNPFNLDLCRTGLLFNNC